MKKKLVFMLLVLSIQTYGINAQQLFNSKANTLSPIEIIVSNYGHQFYNHGTFSSGFYYPRGSQNQYIFGGGLWFGGQKRVDGALKKLVTITYNPNSGMSWMTPGNVEDGAETEAKDYQKYDIERSTDFNSDGTKKDNGIAWSLWKNDEGIAKTGYYEADINKRNSVVYSKGASFYSDEMFHTRYKDTDLKRYEGGAAAREQAGYPLGLQFDERVLSWKNGVLQTAIIVQYSITNTSNDTLYNCWIGQLTDPDIGVGSQAGNNDYARYFNEGGSEGIYMWTGQNNGEAGKGFHYLGLTLLETPAIIENDPLRVLRQNETVLPYNEQIGIKTAQFSTILEDPILDDKRYDFLSRGAVEQKIDNTDFRVLIASGNFTMLPRQTLRFAYCLSLAPPTITTEADSMPDNAAGIRQLLRNVRDYYYSGLTTDIEENIYDKSLYTIIPNPANSDVIVSGFNIDDNISEISLVDLIGNTYPIEYSLTNNSLQFSVQTLASGYYSIIISKNGKNHRLPLQIVR